MQNKSPAFQFYPETALSHTLHLSDKAFRAYWRMLWWMWLHAKDHCSIEDNDAAWGVAMGIGRASLMRKIKGQIMQDAHPLLQRKNGRIISKRLKKEAKKQAAWRKKSREGGIKSGKARASRKRKKGYRG